MKGMRDTKKYNELITETRFEPHTLFRIVEGDIEEWEITGYKESVSG
jgi:hypothetical protein